MASLLRGTSCQPLALQLSNCYATFRRARVARPVLVALAGLFILSAIAPMAFAQDSELKHSTTEGKGAADIPTFLAGAAVALGAHEAGHLLFDGIFQADVGIQKVDFHGIPFFAITHRPDLPWREEYVIDSMGFFVQHATDEWILHTHPRLKTEHQPFLKGMFAFNILASVAYAGAGFAQTGPVERDTRGMAESAHRKEPVIAALVLAPAVLDAIRYFQPQARWAAWTSRGVKVGLVLMVVAR